MTKEGRSRVCAQKRLDNEQAKVLVGDLMSHISCSSSAADLLAKLGDMPNWPRIKKNMPGEKFPRLLMRITPEAIGELRVMGVLTDDLKLSPILASGKLNSGQPLSALEKLMYAVLWKNGDLGKEQHVAAGVYGQGHAQKTGMVFYEFGGYLSGRNNFIMDQHTLRCFAVAAADGNAAIERARKIETIDRTKEPFKSWLRAYTDFYKNIEPKGPDYLYEVDRLLFGAGKLIKKLS